VRELLGEHAIRALQASAQRRERQCELAEHSDALGTVAGEQPAHPSRRWAGAGVEASTS
jgi:hypothetical protein